MAESDDWREGVLSAMLHIALWLVPVTGAVAIVFRRPPVADGAAAVVTLTAAIFVALRFARFSYRARAWSMLVALIMPMIYVVVASGAAPGAAACALICVVFAAVFLGRGAMLGTLCVLPVTCLVVGALVTRGGDDPVLWRTADVDPSIYSNWVRMAVVQGLLAYLLGSAVEFVIRQVEAGREQAAQAASQLGLAYAQLGRLHRRLESAKEDERRHLSRELHDELGQSLTALKLRLQTLKRNSPSAGPSPVDDSLALVDDLLRRVRELAVNLRPPLLDELGLEAALRAHLEEQARIAGVEIDFESVGLGERLPAEVEMTCFRVVQEAATNVARHAQARRATVRIERVGDRLSLRVVDDGQGMSAMDAASYGRAGHLGLVGMRERTRALGGELRLSSPPEGLPSGMQVDVTLPVQPAASPAS